ncbi:hypothetical protein G5714_020270 [Onychostoma macrolepis]|uniref:Uncharacterized protein n=1 Tax=Onychostoma macrolepis TaxID=369639 RepID=A0A7J6BTC2_9TELE|nr:hypothetical protein G5714_020270 [Onychostoma macrolepis]
MPTDHRLRCCVRGFVLTARHVRIVSVIVSPPSLFLCSLAHLVSHQAPVLVAASVLSCTSLCIQIPVGSLWLPPYLGLCRLVSGSLSLSLGLVSCLAGFFSTAAVVACSSRYYPPICVVGNPSSTQAVCGSAARLF